MLLSCQENPEAILVAINGQILAVRMNLLLRNPLKGERGG